MAAMDVRWTPSSAEEKNYYDRLFQLADTSGARRLAGSSAVTFLQASGLPFPLLKQVKNLTTPMLLRTSFGNSYMQYYRYAPHHLCLSCKSTLPT